MANKIMRGVNVAETVKQAIRWVSSEPCKICRYEGLCGVKYKGTCKIARQIRIVLHGARIKAEELK